MKAMIEDGVLFIESESIEESEAVHEWFERFRGGYCETSVNIPIEFMSADMLGKDIH